MNIRTTKDAAVKQQRESLPPPEYLDTHSAAAYLGLTRKQLEHWRCRGGGPPFLKVSRRIVRYSRADLDTWMAEHRVHNTCEEVQNHDNA